MFSLTKHRRTGMFGFLAIITILAVLPAVRADAGRYLVVAAPDYVGTAALNQFVAAKMAGGYDVTVYSVPVGTAREAIKASIQSWYVAGEPSFVFLIGDTCGTTTPSTSANLPHWTGGGTMSSPTDLPYACMGAGDDWFPDLYLGRLAIDTVTELQAYVDKLLFVEAGVFSDPDYIKRAALLATSDSSAQAVATHNAAIANYLDPAGFTSTRIYASQGGDTPEVIDAINAGTLLTIYMGHSSHGGWWEPAFQNQHIPSLNNNGLYGLMLAFSCSSAGIDWFYAECLGETVLREANRGAVTFIGTTTLLPMGGDMWLPTQRMESYFLDALLVQNTWQVGPLMQAMLYGLYTDPDYGPSHSHTRNYYETFILLGDPSLVLPHEQGVIGDLDGDGDVDIADLAQLLAHYGMTGATPADGDLDGDGDVDIADLAALLANYGTGS